MSIAITSQCQSCILGHTVLANYISLSVTIIRIAPTFKGESEYSLLMKASRISFSSSFMQQKTLIQQVIPNLHSENSAKYQHCPKSWPLFPRIKNFLLLLSVPYTLGISWVTSLEACLLEIVYLSDWGPFRNSRPYFGPQIISYPQNFSPVPFMPSLQQVYFAFGFSSWAQRATRLTLFYLASLIVSLKSLVKFPFLRQSGITQTDCIHQF